MADRRVAASSRWRATVVAVGAVTMLLAACGDTAEPGRAEDQVAASASPEPERTPEPSSTPSATVSPTRSEPEASEPPSREDGVLTIGALLPRTGQNRWLAPPFRAGAELAVADINAAGGVLGRPLELVLADTGDVSTDQHERALTKVFDADADVLLGAGSSGMTFTVIDQVVEEGLVMISPANNSPVLTTYEDGDRYFRTSPSDALNGAALGQALAQDDRTRVALVVGAVDDGVPLVVDQVRERVEAAGGEVTAEVAFNPQASAATLDLEALRAGEPDAVAILGFPQQANGLLARLTDEGPWSMRQLYGIDIDYWYSVAQNPDVNLAGLNAVGPMATRDMQPFFDRLFIESPDLVEVVYAAESYDAVISAALATEVAGTDATAQIAAHLPDVTRGGTVCGGYPKCRQLIAGGGDPDYDGQSGPIELSDEGDPTAGAYAVWTFNSEGGGEMRDSVEFKLKE